MTDESSALETEAETETETALESGESVGRSDGDDTPDRPRTAVRGDEPAARCPYCGQPFHAQRFETLHRGLEHPERLSEDERTAFERTYLEEQREVRRFRLLALGAVVLCYFGLLMLYAVVI